MVRSSPHQSHESMPNLPFQRTRATRLLGVFGFRGVARGADRGRWARRRKSKSAGRQGPRRYFAVAVLEGKASVCTTCFFGLWLSFAVCRFVPAPWCSNPAWCKPSGPRRPARHCPGFRLSRPLSFLARLAGGVSALSEAQPGAQGDRTRGYALACFHLV